MKFKALTLLCLTAALYGNAQNTRDIAKQLIEKSQLAMGGDAWKKVSTLSFDGYGYANLIDQSERPEGPSIPVQLSRHILNYLPVNTFVVRLLVFFFVFGCF